MNENAATDKELANQIFALLLVAEKPLGFEEIEEIIGKKISKQQRTCIYDWYSANCKNQAWEVKHVAGGIRIQIKEQFTLLVQKYLQRAPLKLTRTQLEILSIVAHKEKVTRAQIETIRGVKINSSTLLQLKNYGWLKEAGHLSIPGKPILYSITSQLVNDLNLTSKKELTNKLDNFIKDAELQLKKNELPDQAAISQLEDSISSNSPVDSNNSSATEKNTS